RFHPKRLLKRAVARSLDVFEILRALPKDIQDMTKTVQKCRLKFNINVENAPSFLPRLDRSSDRLAFNVVLVSYSILMVGLIIGSAIAGVSNLLFKLLLIELGGIVALIMFLFMLFSIFRSGRM